MENIKNKIMYGKNYHRLTLHKKKIGRGLIDEATARFFKSGGEVEELPPADAQNPVNLDLDFYQTSINYDYENKNHY